MWFVFPQIAALGHSATERAYAISSLDEARAGDREERLSRHDRRDDRRARRGQPREFDAFFDGKADCFAAAHDAMGEEFVDHIRTAYVEYPAWRDGLRNAAYAAFDYFMEDLARTRFGKGP